MLSSPHVLEILLVLAALATALWVQPWRLLAFDSPYALIAPLVLMGTALPMLWWWPGAGVSPLLALVGANLALLTLGWPLAVLVFGIAGAFGAISGQAGWGAAAAAVCWWGVVPATLALLAGHAVRTAFRAHVLSYLLGRAFLIPLACTFASAVAAQWLTGRFDALGAEAAPALFLVALIDAMLTGIVVVLLVAEQPTWLATWSDRLYLRQPARKRGWTRPAARG